MSQSAKQQTDLIEHPLLQTFDISLIASGYWPIGWAKESFNQIED